MMERRIKLKYVNPHITCGICKGYLIDATTITECLHTFCKSCLVKFLEENNTCPTCKLVIHQSHPMNYISFDRTMQDIVYKLVPSLQEKEAKKQHEFYKQQGLSCPTTVTAPEDTSEVVKVPQEKEENKDYHRSDEQLNVCLECKGLNLKHLKRKYLRLSSQATIVQLKKFIALKVFNNLPRYTDIDILCNEELLGKDHTLKFVAVTRWRVKLKSSPHNSDARLFDFMNFLAERLRHGPDALAQLYTDIIRYTREPTLQYVIIPTTWDLSHVLTERVGITDKPLHLQYRQRLDI